jgi:hypothetical protein
MALGGIVGLVAVYLVANLGAVIPLQIRGAILGSLMGVLLAPLIAMALFVFMIVPILNIGLLGVLGDCTWNNISDALNQRRLRPLLTPFVTFIVLPMALCAVGGSKTKTLTAPQYVAAALGALALGVVIGGILANISRRRKPSREFTVKSVE